MIPMNFSHITDRWKWDGLRATRLRVAVAVRRTGNDFGITLSGRPYLVPRVGMRVESYDGRPGRIVALRGRRGRDPQATIRLTDGRTVYLYQTALRGYRILARRRSSS
jgi:hypothetical protein